jgi:uncharacterized protein YbcI
MVYSAAWFLSSSFRAVTLRGRESSERMDSQAAPEQPGTFEQRRGLGLVELSNAMVKIYKEQFGRGPSKTVTNYAGPNVLITTLENSLTPAERRMVEMGEHQRLRDTRMFFQYASVAEFTETVERITGRTVRGFVSGIDAEQDISSEVFYLEPRS